MRPAWLGLVAATFLTPWCGLGGVYHTHNHRKGNRHTQARKDISDAAKRALAEASDRREKAKAMELPEELGGRDGPEPFVLAIGKKGIAVDF
jgi:hypothetical protein